MLLGHLHCWVPKSHRDPVGEEGATHGHTPPDVGVLPSGHDAQIAIQIPVDGFSTKLFGHTQLPFTGTFPLPLGQLTILHVPVTSSHVSFAAHGA